MCFFFSLTHCSFIGIIKRWENFYRRRQLSSIVNFITLADIAPRDRLTSRLDRVVVSWGYDPKGRWPAISPIHSPSRSFLQTKFKGGEIVPSLGILVRDSWSWQGWRERDYGRGNGVRNGIGIERFLWNLQVPDDLLTFSSYINSFPRNLSLLKWKERNSRKFSSRFEIKDAKIFSLGKIY